MFRVIASAALPVVLALGWLSGEAHAQSAAAPEPLSLEAAVARAREANPEHRKAANDLRVADAAERRAIGAFLPELRLSLGTDLTSSTTVTGQDDFGQPVELEDPIDFTRTGSSQAVSMTLPIFEGGRRFAEASLARAQARVARAGVRAEVVRLDAEVRRSYYTAVRYAMQADLEELRVASAVDHVEATRRLLAVAARDPLDLLGAEVEAARQERAAREAGARARQALLRLAELMGESGGADYVLTDSLPEVFDPAGLDPDVLVARALDASPEVARADAAAEAADRSVSVARAARWPTLSLNATYGRNIGGAGTAAFGDLDPSNSYRALGLSFSLPVFSGFQTSYQVTQARMGRADAEEDLRAARLRVEREVRAALVDLEVAYGSAALADRAARLAADRLEMARERYTLGTLSFTDLRDIVDQAASAEREALAARAVFAEALVTLEERVGADVDA